MGMYDYIKLEINCPKCGAKVDGFQSKDGPCCLAQLEFWEVDNFYSSCKQCGAWIEYNIRGKKSPIPLTDYEMSVVVKE